MDVLSPTDNEELTTILRRFWDTESLGIQDANELMTIDQPFLKDIRHNERHYEVSLPWIRDCLELCSNYTLSLNRLRHLQSRLLRRPELLVEYNNILQEQLQKGIIEKVEAVNGHDTVKPIHYMPHHVVIREDKKTTKLRIIYDGSA